MQPENAAGILPRAIHSGSVPVVDELEIIVVLPQCRRCVSYFAIEYDYGKFENSRILSSKEILNVSRA